MTRICSYLGESVDKGDLVLQCLVDHAVLLESGLALKHGRHDLEFKVLSAATYTKQQKNRYPRAHPK